MTSLPILYPPTFEDAKLEERDTSIAVLMSGGVDSSVTAMLLRDAGWNIVGITMKIPSAGECLGRRPCCGTGAALVCKDLGVPHYFVGTEAAFDERVIAPFREAYYSGRTPSPCVDCNTHLKFSLVWDAIRNHLGIQRIATGHYVRVVRDNNTGQILLKRACDKTRDQSYFLYGIPRNRLDNLHFPLGVLAKTAVRQIAAKRRVFVASKPDSMELCFASEGDYRLVLSGHSPFGGPIYDINGRYLGEHQGIHNFTIGQRRGLGISNSERLYVLEIHPESNSVVVGPRKLGYRRRVRALLSNILQPDKFGIDSEALGKVRSIGDPERCQVRCIGPAAFEVEFEDPVFAPAPGQHLVLYDDNEAIIAGGIITSQ